jgi:hypothetical protein
MTRRNQLDIRLLVDLRKYGCDHWLLRRKLPFTTGGNVIRTHNSVKTQRSSHVFHVERLSKSAK